MSKSTIPLPCVAEKSSRSSRIAVRFRSFPRGCLREICTGNKFAPHRSFANTPGVSETNHHPKASPLAGKIFLVAIGLALALIGSVFFWLMWRSFDRANHMRDWPEVECVILSAEVEERRIDPNGPAEFRVDVAYGYVWKGVPYTSDRITLRGNPWTSKSDVIEERSLEYREGMTTTCRVDPARPELAVLKMDSKAPGYSIWFPALFIVGGLGISIRALIPLKKTQQKLP